jgi:hypothetical protein
MRSCVFDKQVQLRMGQARAGPTYAAGAMRKANGAIKILMRP